MGDAIESATINLIRTNGRSELSVTKYLETLLGNTSPLLTWGDPVPTWRRSDGTTGRVDNFQPLVIGAHSWGVDLPLAEARLFWADAALHVVASEGTGCRWARIQECAQGDASMGEQFSRSTSTVMTLRDRSRFGLGIGDIKDMNLIAIEYRSQGRLVAWRLETEE